MSKEPGSRNVTSLIDGRGYTEGPVALPGGGVAFTSMSEGRVIFLEGDRIVREVVTGGGPTGLLRDAQGRIFVAQNNGQWGAPSGAEAVLAVIDQGDLAPALDAPLIAPNDLCFGPDGRLFVTDPLTEAALDSPVPGKVYAWDPVTGGVDLLSDDILFPNGIAFDAGGHLYVAETFTGRILRLDHSSGEPRTRIVAETVDGRPDGMAFDVEGNLWVAVNASDSVQVFAPSGELVDRLHLGEGSYPSNLCFAGSTLFVTTAGYGGLVSIDVEVEGLPLHGGSAVHASANEGRDDA